MSEIVEDVIRVMVVDDSSIIRKIYKNILSKHRSFSIIAEAENGLKALLKQRENNIDVIVLDVEMPVMNGMEALPRLLSYDPSLVIIMASGTSAENTDITLRALKHGAMECLIKPSATNALNGCDNFSDKLVSTTHILGRERQRKSKLKNNYLALKQRAIAENASQHLSSSELGKTEMRNTLASEEDFAKKQARFIRYHAGAIRGTPAKQPLNKKTSTDTSSRIQPLEKTERTPQQESKQNSGENPKTEAASNPAFHPPSKEKPEAFAIGASTGAVRIFKDFLPELSKIGPPIFLTQHMDHFFTAALMRQFTSWGNVNAVEVDNRYEVIPHTIYIAQGGKHMVAEKTDNKIFIMPSDTPAENFCKPSIDTMLRSLSAIYQQKLLAIILSGMGQDGTQGSKKVVQSGGTVIVQDEASSIIWSMPHNIVQSDIASAIVPPARVVPWYKKQFSA